MAVIFTDLLTASTTWIVGLLGISAMAFFLGCAGCRQYKPREGADRRPPPPTPESEHNPRYQEELFPPTPSLSAAYSFPNTTRDDDDYEDDFEELPITTITHQLNKNIPNSLPSQNTTKVPVVRSSVESEEKESLSESRCHSYENVVHADGSLAFIPVMRKDHTYLEVFPSDAELELPTADKGIATAIRSSVESEGKVSMLSENSCHSYENVTNVTNVTNGSPSSVESDLEGDYVNLKL